MWFLNIEHAKFRKQKFDNEVMLTPIKDVAVYGALIGVSSSLETRRIQDAWC